ncbi:MAG: tyrosine-type recombinase/integrase [Methylacidiphilales bacterium]|nr:tyrosine-type recombinase/integrase [Candidatus Methylacidiphilales bacterium]
MPKRSSIAPNKVQGRVKPWKIDLPSSLSPTGKRQRFFFATKQEASNFGDEQRTRIDNYGTAGLSGLSPAQLEQAALAFDAIKPHGVTLNEAIKEWCALRVARDATVTFSVAEEQYMAYIATKKVKGRPVSDSYRSQIKQTFPRFPSLHSLPLTDIDGKKIAGDMVKMTPATKNALLRVLSAFFSWCGQTPREWIKTNPAAKVPRESIGAGEVALYAPDEVKRILAASPDDLLPHFLFGFFAGIRPEELERLQWEHVNIAEGHIEMPASITKTATRRVVAIDPTLSAWLRSYISRRGIPRGNVTPLKNLRRRLRATRKAAKVETIQDGMRHSYASYWLAVNKDEHRLRENLGHRSSDELWDHYHRACTEKEAKQFWAIRPEEKKQRKIVLFKREKAA